MSRLARRLVLLAAFFLAAVSVLTADDWPQFRGQKRDGVSAEKGLLAQWPAKGPALVWKSDKAGLGFSSVAIVGDKLYTLGTVKEEEALLAFDAAKGDLLWSLPYGPIFTFKDNTWGDGPRGTPTIDGGKAYALGGQGILVCIDLAEKKILWKHDLVKDFGAEMMTEWGFSESPLVDGDKVIVTPGGAKGLVLALDKNSGKALWQTKDVTHKAPYSSVMPVDVDGVRQYVQNGYDSTGPGGYLSGFDAKSGKLLWQQQTIKGDSFAIAPTPVVRGNIVYTTSEGVGCHAYEVGAKGAKELYAKKEQKTTKNTHGGVVLVNDLIYGHSETLGWVCQDLLGLHNEDKIKGKILWNARNDFQTKSGSIAAADGKLFLYTEEGKVALADASPKAFNIVSEFSLPTLSQYPKTRKTSKDSKAWNNPVIANGNLYLRDCELIYCYKIK